MRLFFLLLTIIAMSSFRNNGTLTVSSPDFANNGLIPAKFSCEGQEISPALKISDIPAGARSLALIVHDPDAPHPGGFTHWVVWNISTNGEIPENFKQGEQGENGAKQHGYKGMCPPSGTHHYHFRVYALDTKLDIDRESGKDELEKALKGHILAEGELIGLYKKTK